MSAKPPRVPSPNPYARDTGQKHVGWDKDWDTLGTSPAAKAREPQETAATAVAGRDTLWDKTGTSALLGCPKPLLPLVPVGQVASPAWTVQDWRAFHDERFSIRHHDGGASEAAAVRGAWLDCLRLWLERHPPPPAALEAWPADTLRLARIAEAVHALAALGVYEHPPGKPPFSGAQ